MVTVIGGFGMFQGAVPSAFSLPKSTRSFTNSTILACAARLQWLTWLTPLSSVKLCETQSKSLSPELDAWYLLHFVAACCTDPFPTMNKASVCWSICKVIPRRIWSIGWVTWVTWVTFGGWSIRWNPQCFIIVPNCGPLNHEDLLLSLPLGLPTSSGGALQSAWRQALDGRHLMSGQLGCHPTPYNLCMVSQVPRFSLWHISPFQNLSKSF